MSLGEVMMRPTAMLFRNLASMDVEEAIRANPLDGVVLLMGCDKTTPALLMGAASVDIPTIGVSGGPMLRGIHCGKPIGSGTNMISMSEQLRAGQITLAEFHEAEADMHRSHGHCMTMGTASTMACMVEALGVGMPGNAAIPAVDARRNLLAREAGRRIVELVRDRHRAVEDPHPPGVRERDPRQRRHRRLDQRRRAPDRDRAAHRRRSRARRLGPPRTRRALPRRHHAVGAVPDGGLLRGGRTAGGDPRARAARAAARGRPDGQRPHASARTTRSAQCWKPEVIRTFDEPFKRDAGIAVLRGNLAPDGAIIKPSAASPHLMQHTGPRRRVRVDRGPARADQRRRARHRRELGHGAQVLRAEGLSRHGRGRQHAAAAEAPEARHHRRRAHLRRADVRHRLRHRRAAHGTGGRGRRHAGAGARTATGSRSTCRDAGSTSTSTTRSSRAAARRGSRPRRTPSAAT